MSADASGNVLSDTPESSLSAAQAQAIAGLKQQLPGLLPPHVLTQAEEMQVLGEATLITGQTLLARSGAKNVISGNAGSGVHLSGSSTGNSVINSLIGTDPTGTFSNQSLQNASGITIDGSDHSQNVIGGQATWSSGGVPTITGYAGNVVSGNAQAGISISSGSNLIVNNIIGGALTGTTAIPNGTDGIDLTSPAANTVGATTSASLLGGTGTTLGGNLITGNLHYGLSVTGVSGANTVVANIIGSTTANGAFNLQGGILLKDSADQVIGGSPVLNPDLSVAALDAGANLIEGNGGQGVLIDYAGTSAKGGNNTIEGNLISRNSLDGIALMESMPMSQQNVGADQVLGNFIGTDVTGSTTFDNTNNVALGNGLSGVDLQGIAANILGNLISGNGLAGIAAVSPTGSGGATVSATIQGNKIGTNLAGTSTVALEGKTQATIPLGNVLDGILLDDVVGVTIGASTAGKMNIGGVSIYGMAVPGANLISGNLGRGIEIRGDQTAIPSIPSISNTNSNTIQYNLIGTDISGTNATGLASNAALNTKSTYFSLGNLSDGIFLFDAPNSVIENNLISNNRGAGIHARQEDRAIPSGSLQITENLIGTSGTGTFAQDSLKNSLGNSSDGIFLDNLGGSLPRRRRPGERDLGQPFQRARPASNSECTRSAKRHRYRRGRRRIGAGQCRQWNFHQSSKQ